MTKIYKENERYYMNDNDNIIDITNNIQLNPRNQYEIKLPQNSSNRKYISLSKFNDRDEIILDYKESRTLDKSENKITSKPVSRLNFEEFISDEDLEIYNQIKERALKRMRKFEIEKEIEVQKKILDEMIKKLENEA